MINSLVCVALPVLRKASPGPSKGGEAKLAGNDG